ncbi:MAG: S8 family serine peptidase [bacterium]|nr:S8 family serine peptidase [bacterium]
MDTTKLPKDQKMHIILQFASIPSKNERESLENCGVKLLSGAYLHTNAWFAAVSTKAIPRLIMDPKILWAGEIEPKDRLSPALNDFLYRKITDPEWTDSKGQVHLFVNFFSDVSQHEARLVLSGHGTAIQTGGWSPILNGLPCIIDADDHKILTKLMDEDAIQWIEPESLPVGNEEDLDYSRPELEVDLVAKAPYNLTGDGIPLMIYDSSSVRDTHLGFSGRVNLADPKGPSSDSNRPPETHRHATAVAGVMCGNGRPIQNRNLSGMAPEAELYSYWKVNFNFSEGEGAFGDAINERNVYVSQNSWGIVTRSGGPSCVDPRFTDNDGFADYGSKSRWFDLVAAGSMNEFGNDRIPLIVFSAGNERDDRFGGTDMNHTDYVNFGTINIPKTAKNVLVVGATYDDDGDPDTIHTQDHSHTEIYSGSNWGPCDDGRLKPEVMAPGGTYGNFPGPGGDDNINTTDGRADGAYRPYMATSLAAPHVSGISALLVEEYRKNHKEDLASSTLKALIIHGSRDIVNICSSGTHLGGYYGPDYMTGYGQVRARASAEIIKNDSENSTLLIEDEIDNTGEIEYTVRVVPGAERLKLTLAWNDLEAGTPNDGAKELINDIDLLITDPLGNEYFPYTLDPSTPLSQAVFDSPDRLNIVEQVEIVDPNPGWWRVKVTGFSIPSGPQPFSLVSDLPLRVEQAPRVFLRSPDGGEELNGTVPITWHAEDANRDALAIKISANNGSGWFLVAENEENDGIYYWNTSLGEDGPAYTIRVEATDNSADRLSGNDTSNNTFKVYNPDAPMITLQAPDPTDILQDRVYLNWTVYDPDGDSVSVGLYHSSDMFNWSEIAIYRDNSGSHPWNTRMAPDGHLWLKANATDSSPHSLRGESPIFGPFTLYNPDPPVIQLISPQGETTISGLAPVNWSAQDPDNDTLSIFIYFKQGIMDEWRILETGLPNNGSYIWNTSEMPDGRGYWLRLEAVDDSPEKLKGKDDSDSSFIIHNPDPPRISNLTVGGADPLWGIVDIEWDIWDPDDDSVLIDVAWKNGTGEWINITSGESDMEKWEWDSSKVPDGDNYQLRITATDMSEYSLRGVAVSDPFSIDNPDPPIVNVFYPRGGEILGGTVRIGWNASDADRDLLTADVAYSSDGKKWIDIAEDLDFMEGDVPGSWYYDWDTREFPDGENYRIKVTVKDLSTWAMESADRSGSFRIYNPDAPEISIKAPLYGEILAGKVPIRWRAEDADLEVLLINISVSPDGGNSWEVIAENERNDGAFMWDTGGVKDGTYLIRLTADDGLLQGEAVSRKFVIKNLEDSGLALSLSAGVGIVAMLGLFLGAGIFLMIWRRGKKTTEIAAEKTAVETPDADSTVTYDAPGELALQKIDPPKPVNIKVVQKKIKIIQRTVNDEQNQD